MLVRRGSGYALPGNDAPPPVTRSALSEESVLADLYPSKRPAIHPQTGAGITLLCRASRPVSIAARSFQGA